ncbi:GntR family transcriptional regulator [Mucisphaera calidilacus]|uniref:Arabinose metabolism transcriptional repressor n=1 Tax=Mucisphaera calidilacus TaxID=2527982 RepID=A0A518BX36_9BACT|nr:GntR family transcriptional regulator [Mucisphaera calidilacus]QDU71540.1 Arabinose metabolism transcriptional repressor [Mucisphaera calidilacus]
MSRVATKHQLVFEAVRKEIRDGRFNPGDRIPSDVELVEKFKVSRPTVAKALQELERNGLVIRRPGSGTYVKKTDKDGYLFGLLIPGLGDTEIFEPICGEIARSAQQLNHSLLWGGAGTHTLFDSDEVGSISLDICRQFIQNKVSGIFFAPLVVAEHHNTINQQITQTLTDAGIPVVLLDRDIVPFPNRSGFDLVGINNHRAGFLVTQHLIEQGCDSILFVTDQYRVGTVEARIAGFNQALLLAERPVTPSLIQRCNPRDATFVANMMAAHKPCGIVCGNDVVAANLIHTLDNLDIEVPNHVLVAGIDDVKYAELLRVPLTTIHQPCEAIGRAAIRAMLDRLEMPDMPARDVLVACHLVERASTERLDRLNGKA